MQICVYETYLRENFISLFCVLRRVCECKLSVSSNGQIVIAEQSQLRKEDNLEAWFDGIRVQIDWICFQFALPFILRCV